MEQNPDEARKESWGVWFQETVDGIQTNISRVCDEVTSLKKVTENIQSLVKSGDNTIIQEIRETYRGSVTRADRKNIAIELIQLMELLKALQVESKSEDNSLFDIENEQSKKFKQVEILVNQAMQVCGVEIRDGKEKTFDPRFDKPVAVRPVNEMELNRKVLDVKGNGYSWADGSGVLRPRQVVVGKYQDGGNKWKRR